MKIEEIEALVRGSIFYEAKPVDDTLHVFAWRLAQPKVTSRQLSKLHAPSTILIERHIVRGKVTSPGDVRPTRVSMRDLLQQFWLSEDEAVDVYLRAAGYVVRDAERALKSAWEDLAKAMKTAKAWKAKR